MTFRITHEKGSFALGRLLVTAIATKSSPTLDGVLMTSDTEYWLLDLARWKELEELHADPSTRNSLVLEIGACSTEPEAKSFLSEKVFTAAEATEWDSVAGDAWPKPVMGFGAPSGETLCGIAFESLSMGEQRAVWWAQTKDQNLPVDDVANQTLFASQQPVGAKYFSSSKLVAWPPPQ